MTQPTSWDPDATRVRPAAGSSSQGSWNQNQWSQNQASHNQWSHGATSAPSTNWQHPTWQQPQQQWSQQQWSQQQSSQLQSSQQGPWPAPSGAGQQPAPGAGRRNLLIGAVAAVVVLALIFAAFSGVFGGRKPGEVAYQNEDYTVPDPATAPPKIVMPKSEQDVETYLRNNPIYQQSMPAPVRCELEPIDLTTASKDAIKRQMDALTACMTRAWVVPTTDAGFQVVRPVSNVYSEKVNTPCGNNIPGANAFYCPANQQLYYSTTLPRVLPAELRTKPFVFEVVMAHEYGHLMQGRIGVTASSRYAEMQASSKAAEREMSRRTELQADCFMGMFLKSVALSTKIDQADIDTIRQTSRAVGDDTLSKKPAIDGGHGLARSRDYWAQMGLASEKIGACNTFVAESGTVR